MSVFREPYFYTDDFMYDALEVEAISGAHTPKTQLGRSRLRFR